MAGLWMVFGWFGWFVGGLAYLWMVSSFTASVIFDYLRMILIDNMI